MATILHDNVEVVSIGCGKGREQSVSYIVVDHGQTTNIRVLVIANNFNNTGEVQVTIEKPRKLSSRWPEGLGYQIFSRGEHTLAALSTLRKAGITLRPDVGFRIDNPIPLRAGKIRIRG